MDRIVNLIYDRRFYFLFLPQTHWLYIHDRY